MKQELFLQLIGGFVGGAIGYMIGAGYDSIWMSYTLFFLLAYLGYNFQRVVEECGWTLESTYDELVHFSNDPLSDPLVDVWRKAHRRSLMWTVMIIPWFVLTCIGLFHAELINEWTSGNYATATLIAPFYSFRTLIEAEWNAELATIRMVGLLFAFIFGYIVWVTMTTLLIWAIETIPAILRQIRRVTLSGILWTFIMSLYLMIVMPFKFAALVVVGIHTWRRFSCGLTTMAGGALYLIWVPFNTPLPLPLAAIGCGLFCGACTVAVALILDGEERIAPIKRFAFAPINPIKGMFNNISL